MRQSMGMAMRWLVVTAPLLAIAVSASIDAAADTGDVVIAEVLFRDGRELLAQDDLEHACPKLAESFRLDPATGTLLALALCHERSGKLASAWAEYADAASRSKKEERQDRASAAHAKVVALEDKLSSLTIEFEGGPPARGVVVRRNGAVIPTAWLGTAVPVDGGTIAIEVSGPRHQTWKASVWIESTGDRRVVTIPASWAKAGRAPAGAPAAIATAAGASTDAPHASPDTETVDPEAHVPINAPPAPHHPLTGWQVAGLVTGAVGVVALGVGGVFGALAISKDNDSKNYCLNGGDLCTPAGKSERQDAVNSGNISTTTIAIGGSLAVAGLALVLWGGASEGRPAPTGIASLQAIPAVGTHGAGGMLVGRF